MGICFLPCGRTIWLPPIPLGLELLFGSTPPLLHACVHSRVRGTFCARCLARLLQTVCYDKTVHHCPAKSHFPLFFSLPLRLLIQ